MTRMAEFQVPSHVMLGISKHEETPLTPQRPLSPMGEACSRMDLTAIHQTLVMTHYRDDEGTNEVSDLYSTSFCSLSLDSVLRRCLLNVSVVFSRVDPANEGYVGRKETWRLCFP